MTKIHPPDRDFNTSFLDCCNDRSIKLLLEYFGIKPPIKIEESSEELEHLMRLAPSHQRKLK